MKFRYDIRWALQQDENIAKMCQKYGDKTIPLINGRCVRRDFKSGFNVFENENERPFYPAKHYVGKDFDIWVPEQDFFAKTLRMASAYWAQKNKEMGRLRKAVNYRKDDL